MDVYRQIDRSKLQFDFLVLGESEHYFSDEIYQLGGHLYRVRHPREQGVIASFLDMATIMKRQGPFKAVHAHTSYHSGLALLAARVAGVNYRVCHARTTSTRESQSLRKRITVEMGRILIRQNATSFLAISNEAALYLFGEGLVSSRRVRIVPNAVWTDAYAQLDALDILTLRKKFGIPRCDILIGHVGRFAFMKNQRFLLRLTRVMRDRGLDVRLVLVGTGEMFEEVVAEANRLGLQEHVHFLGLRREIPEIMHMFDIFVMPSLFEGLGGAAIEAQAAGVPCVLSNSMPGEVDMGLELTTFVSLVSNDDTWVEAILSKLRCRRPKHDQVISAFEKRGYSIEAEIRYLLEAYGIE